LIAVVEEGSSRIVYAVAVVGMGRYGFMVDLTTNTVSEWFFAKGGLCEKPRPLHDSGERTRVVGNP
jgi:hypothetical protein